MMKEYALLKGGSIVNTVMTMMSLSEMQAKYCGFEVRELNTLPDDVLEDYQYWNERP